MEENCKVLVIEDDKDLSTIISNTLKKENFIVKTVFDGKSGIEEADQFSPTVILLDLMLPAADGFEVCRAIRTKSYVPIIIISAKKSDMDKMLSLGLGADDYLEKPFSLLELTARVRSHIRRYTTFSQQKQNKEDIIEVGKVKINQMSHQVMVGDEEIELTSKEFALLEFFATHPSQVFSKEQLLDSVWGCNEFVDSNTITVYVGRIREKMTSAGACYIKTVWGAGYKWEMS